MFPSLLDDGSCESCWVNQARACKRDWNNPAKAGRTPVPRCCMSDWHGKIQIHENQESATNSRSMHPMKRPQVIQHHQPKQQINRVDCELLVTPDLHQIGRASCSAAVETRDSA